MHKVAELDGAMLDAAVAKAEGLTIRRSPYNDSWQAKGNRTVPWYSLPGYCTSWAAGGPIIERERISLEPCLPRSAGWDAVVYDKAHSRAPIPLIAAMRAYVASKFGDEVELTAGKQENGDG